MLYRPWEECDDAWHRKKHVGLYSIIGLGGMGGGCLTEARSHGALVFFSFIFSSGGHLVQQRRTV